MKVVIVFICAVFFNAMTFGSEFSEVEEQRTEEYFLGVFAESIGVNSPFGHAFIGVGKGTPFTCRVDAQGTVIYGFYPKEKIDALGSYWLGPIDGAVASDVFRNPDHQFFITIDEIEYYLILQKVEEWKRKQYQLVKNDCISFIIDICKSVPNRSVILPDRTKYDLPQKFVTRIIELNKK